MNYDWKAYKEKRLNEIKDIIIKNNIKPKLAIIEIGNIIESELYVKNKIKACDKVGIETLLYKMKSASEDELLNLIDKLNEDDSIDGILVQLPLLGIDNPSAIINRIDVNKDVDGLTKENYSNLIEDDKDYFIPCTPKGILEMLDVIGTKIEGANVVIIGRSKLVGLPLYPLLLRRNASVSICHSFTKDLSTYTKNADIIISAVGKHKNLISKDMVKEDSIIIDVAITKDDESGTFYGDAFYDDIKDKVKYITPVPGGVGQLTVLELIDNVVLSRLRKNNLF